MPTIDEILEILILPSSGDTYASSSKKILLLHPGRVIMHHLQGTTSIRQQALRLHGKTK